MSYLSGNSPLSYRLGGVTPLRKILGGVVVWSGMDADFAAYLAAGIANGSTMSAGNQTAVEAFIVGCKADGVWTPIKASCLLCAWDSLAGALTPLVGPAPTNNGFVAGDYVSTTGLKGNGTDKRLNANRANNVDPQNSRHIYTYATEPTSISATFLIGTLFQNGGSYVLSSLASQSYRSTGTNVSASIVAAVGGYGVGRSTSTTITRILAGNLASQSNTSATPTSSAIGVFASGSGSGITDARISFYSIGEALDLALLDSRLATLMAALT